MQHFPILLTSFPPWPWDITVLVIVVAAAIRLCKTEVLESWASNFTSSVGSSC